MRPKTDQTKGSQYTRPFACNYNITLQLVAALKLIHSGIGNMFNKESLRVLFGSPTIDFNGFIDQLIIIAIRKPLKGLCSVFKHSLDAADTWPAFRLAFPWRLLSH